MVCQSCGNAVDEQARFCPSCGTEVAATATAPGADTQQGDPDTPVLTIRPVFVPWVALATIMPITLFLTAWAALFCGGLAGTAIGATEAEVPPYLPGIFFAVLCLLGIPGVAYYAKKKTYEDTEYRFFPDRLEYAEGFWTAEHKSIRYDRVVQSNLRRGVIQKMYGLGTIHLLTPAETGGHQASGIKLKDVPEPDKIYQQVQKLVGA